MLSNDDVSRAMHAHAEDKELEELCEANGLSREDFGHRRHTVEALDLFLINYPSLQSTVWFPGLRSLQVWHQHTHAPHRLLPLPKIYGEVNDEHDDEK